MADYDIGGHSVIGGAPDSSEVHEFGVHEESGGTWELGSEIFIGLGNKRLSDLYDRLVEANAVEDDTHTATDCLWFLTGASGDDGCYFGIQAIYSGDNMTTLSIFTSDEPSLEGAHTSLVGGFTPDFRDNSVVGIWAQCYMEEVLEEGHLKKLPYIGFGGRQMYGSEHLSYENCKARLAVNDEDFSPIAAFPLQTYAGDYIDDQKESDTSKPDGGEGDWDNGSDTIPWPDLPVLGAANCGFVTVYNPSVNELHDFADFLWSSADQVFDNIAKYQSNMLDLIVSLSVVPVDPVVSSAVQLKIGGKTVPDVMMYPVLNQYIAYDCGTFNLHQYYGNALDFGPYTKVQLFLPYIGFRELKPDEVMGGSISVRYHIDLVTGTCVAMVGCHRDTLNAPVYQFEGNMSMQIPIISRDFMNMYKTVASTIDNLAAAGSGGGNVGAGMGLASTALNVMTMKPTIQRAGSLSCNAGFLGSSKPFLIIERPIQAEPASSNTFYGYPSNITYKLSALKGYTECEAVRFSGMTCTAEEQNIIKQKMSDGIIL